MQPDYNMLTTQFWGSGHETAVGLLSGSNIVLGSNPPWTTTDFFAFYPKFGGKTTEITGTLTAGSPVVDGVSSLAAGQLITGPGIPSGTVIISVDGDNQQATLSQPAAASGDVSLTVYVAPLVPLAVVNAYIALASASLVQARWRDTWALAMGWFVAHFVTLWMRSDGDAYSTPGQVAASGISRGITVSKSAGGVSQGIQALDDLAGWAQWRQTTYGEQFASFARIIGAGPMLVY